MKFLDEVKKKTRYSLGKLAAYDHGSYAKFEGSKVIITPDSDYSKLELFTDRGSIDAVMRPITVDLGSEPIKAKILGKLTHREIANLLENSEADRLAGYMGYAMPLNHVRLEGFPREFNDNLGRVTIMDGHRDLVRMPDVSKTPVVATFNEDSKEWIEKLLTVEKIEQKPRQDELTVFLKAKPALDAIEKLARSIAERPRVEMTVINPERSKIMDVNEIYDMPLVDMKGDFGSHCHVSMGPFSTEFSINSPFEKSIDSFERSFDTKRISYGSVL